MSGPPADPWTRVRTANDLPADEVISALQKEIRRGHVENAAAMAYELITTSPELERKLWDRLAIISVEDVGFGEPMAPVVVVALERLSRRWERSEGDRTLVAIHAVRYLATRTKERGSDELANWLRAGFADGSVRPEIPDYAIDMHTARGQAMDRGARHFHEEAAQVKPELADRDRTYYDRITERLSEEPDSG